MSYWFRNDNRLPQERLAAASYVIVGMITLLLFGFWKLQVIDSDKYGQLAERNRVRSIPIIAPRGRMLELGEAASMICWLASEENSFTTAAIFDLSGGRATY